MTTVKLSSLSVKLRRAIKKEALVRKATLAAFRIRDLETSLLGYVICPRQYKNGVQTLLEAIDKNKEDDLSYEKLINIPNLIFEKKILDEVNTIVNLRDLYEGYFPL